MCCPFQYMNIWFNMNVFKTHPIKWYLIYYGYALDTERYLTCIPALVSNNSEFNLLTKIMTDSLCCFHSKIWLKAVEMWHLCLVLVLCGSPWSFAAGEGVSPVLPTRSSCSNLQGSGAPWQTTPGLTLAPCACATPALDSEGYVTFPFQI